MLQLETKVSSRDRAEASDDFEARLDYAEQKLEMARLEQDATLARERSEAMARQHRLTGFVIVLSIAIVLALAYFSMSSAGSIDGCKRHWMHACAL